MPIGKGEDNMEKKYKAVCTIKENAKEYVIYRNLNNNRFYKKIAGKMVRLPLEDDKFYKGMETLNDKISCDKQIKIKKEKKRKAGKLATKGIAALLVISLLGCAVHENYIYNTPKREYKHSEKTQDDVMQLFIKSMENNKSISRACARELKRYLEVFVDECNKLGLDNDEVYIKIAKQLRLKDFYDNEVLFFGDLCDIFDFRNGKFIAAQLFSYLNDASFNYQYNTIAKFLYFSEEGRKDLLSGNKIKVDINDEVYEINLKDLDKNSDELYDLLDRYVDQKLEIKDKTSYLCRANIFSSVIEKYSCDMEMLLYYELQEDGKVENVTYREYFKKLADLIYTERDELDYSNATDRSLVYLQIEALRLNFGEQWEEEPTEYIMDSILQGNIFFSQIITPMDLFRYLNGKPLDTNLLVDQWDLILMGEESLGCVQELNKCLKVEVALGNLSQEDYKYFINRVIETIELLYPERLEEFKEANLYNNSIGGFELRLFPSREL